MRKITAIAFAIICLIILIFSYSAWKDKIQAAGGPQAEPAMLDAQEKGTDLDAAESFPSLDTSVLPAAMNPAIRTLFTNRSEAGETVQVLVVGSQAMESGAPGYAELFTTAMADAYSGFVEIDSLAFDGTSAAFTEEDIDLGAGYDVVVLEPFTLNDNGRVEIERGHAYIEEFADRVRSEVADAVLVLHPPQPIYGAQFYLTQVNALEEFALQRNYGYINHWTAWPDTNDIALKTYLTDSGSPAQPGAEAWATELSKYFIAN